MGYVIAVAWLLARHSELSDDDIEQYGRAMGATIDQWHVSTPVVRLLSALYDATVNGRAYDPPGARPDRPAGEGPM